MSVNLLGMSTLSSLTGSMNYANLIQSLYQADRAPGDALNSQMQTDQLQINDWSKIGQLANTLQGDLVTLGTDTTYTSNTTSVTGTSVTSATATASSSPGTYNVTLTSAGSFATLTSANSTNSNGEIGSQITSSNASTTTLNSNVFNQPVTNGTIQIQVGTSSGTTSYTYKVDNTQTLQTVLQGISTQTGVTFSISGNKVTATAPSGATVQFGSAGDTSNFLSVIGLNGLSTTSTSTSVTGGLLGVAQLTQSLAQGNFAAPVTATTTGQLQINGQIIKYNTSVDSLQTLISNINASSAGVTAAYNPLTDKVVLTSKTAQSISVQDVSGNMGAVLGLTSGVSQAGSNWTYSVGSQTGLQSASPQISSVIPGVTFTLSSDSAQNGQSSTVTVSQNTKTLTDAVNQFVSDFNNLYGAVSGYVKQGGDLADNPTLTRFLSEVMTAAQNVIPSAQAAGYADTSPMDIGINTGNIGSAPNSTNQLQVDTTKLTSQFSNNPSDVKSVLEGMATNLNNLLTNFTGTFNSLTPTSTYSNFSTGIVDSQKTALNSEIQNLLKQQNQIYATAAQQESQLQQSFNALQQYQAQAAMEAQSLAAITGTSAFKA